MTAYRLAAIADAHPSLPPLPKDALGRYVRWILVTDTDGFHAKNLATGEFQFIPVSEAWIDSKVAQYAEMQDGQYDAPLQAEHDGAVTGGQRLGDVLALASWKTPTGKTALIAAVAFVFPDAEGRIKRGMIRYFSPGFGTWTDDRGRPFKSALLELSLTTQPQQIGKGPTHVLAANTQEAPMADEKPTEDVDLMADGDTPDLAARLEALETSLASLAGTVEALSAKLMAEEEPSDPDGEPVEEEEAQMSAKLSAELAETRRELARARFDAGFPEGHVLRVNLSASTRETLFALHVADKDAFQALIDASAPAPSEPAEAVEPEPAPVQLSTGVAWDVLLGARANEPTNVIPAKADLWEQAQSECGGATAEANARFKELKAAHGLA